LFCSVAQISLFCYLSRSNIARCSGWLWFPHRHRLSQSSGVEKARCSFGGRSACCGYGRSIWYSIWFWLGSTSKTWPVLCLIQSRYWYISNPPEDQWRPSWFLSYRLLTSVSSDHYGTMSRRICS